MADFPTKHLPYTEGTGSSSGKQMFEIFYSLSSETPKGAFPLWTGEWILNCRTLYPEFWAECIRRRNNGTIRVVTNDTYESECAQTPDNPLISQENRGFDQCPAFVLDETNGNVRLPKIQWYIKASYPSTFFKAGLDQIVNIKGGNKAVENQGNFGGPLYQSGWSDNSRCGDQDHAGPFMGFNAALCVRTGPYVEPRHCDLPLYIQVYDTVVLPSSFNMASLVTNLNSRMTSVETQVNGALNPFKSFTKSQNGELTLNNGFILKWGIGSEVNDEEQNYSISFPTPFPNTCLHVQITPKLNAHQSGADCWFQLLSFTNSSFIYEYAHTSERYGYSLRASWLAIGY